MHWTSIFHNTVNVTFTPLPGLIVSVSDGNIGLPDINLTLRKGVIMTIEQFVILIKSLSSILRVTERHTR